MKVLKVICLVLAVVYLAAVVVGPLPESTIRDPVAYRLICLLSASIFGGLYYGINKKLAVVWKLGWIVVIGIPLTVIISALSSTVSLPPPENWIASSGIVVGGGGAFSIWAVWWKRQRAYFNDCP